MWARTLLSILLVISLGWAYYYFDIIKAGERESAELKSSRAIGIVADDVISLTIEREGKILSLVKTDGDWKIVEPIAVDADNNAVELLLVAAQYMTISGKVGDIKQYSKADYGITGQTNIIFGIPNGEKKTLTVGDLSPVGTDFYAIGKDEGIIVLVNQGRVYALLKNLFELRNKDVFPVMTADVTTLTMHLGEHVIEATKNNDTGWRLIKPINARGDNKAIERIVDNLAALVYSGFLDEEDNDVLKYGLDRPIASFTLVSGSEKDTRTLLVGRGTGGGGFYAKRKDRPTIARIASGIMKSFPEKIDNLRDRNLVHFAMDTIEKIEIDHNGEIVSLEISDVNTEDEEQEKIWHIMKPTPGKPDVQAVFSLLVDIERAKAVRFVNENKLNLAVIGDGKPDVTLTVTSKTGASVIKITTANEDKEKRYYAQVDANESIYEIDKSTYRNLAKGYDDLRYKKVLHIKSSDVGRIVIERVGQIFEVTRTDDNYHLVRPENRKLEDDEYNRFVWTVLGLKYDEVADGGDRAKMGFDTPSLTISVYNAKGSLEDKITVGLRANGEKHFYLKSQNIETIYLINERFVTENIVNGLERLIGQ